MRSRRQEFLNDFLGALGAQAIDYTHIQEDLIEGFSIHDLKDSEEKQAFRWHGKESDAPSQVAFNLVKIIRRDKLLSIDKLIVPEDVLFSRLEGNVAKEDFDRGLEELLSIEVPMLDGGEETDAYFIHQ